MVDHDPVEPEQRRRSVRIFELPADEIASDVVPDHESVFLRARIEANELDDAETAVLHELVLDIVGDRIEPAADLDGDMWGAALPDLPRTELVVGHSKRVVVAPKSKENAGVREGAGAAAPCGAAHSGTSRRESSGAAPVSGERPQPDHFTDSTRRPCCRRHARRRVAASARQWPDRCARSLRRPWRSGALVRS